MKLTTFVALVMCAFAAPSAEAKIYKWTDANGKVHYSATQPPASASSSKTDRPKAILQTSAIRSIIG
ncbi:MAG: hypothetical protein ACI9DC_001145 [Gammaproteobacteria bacterium]|jgi:hypothetical protein